MKNLNELGVQELNVQEMKKTDGGLGWGDALLIAEWYQKACQVCDEFMMNNHEYTAGRSFNR